MFEDVLFSVLPSVLPSMAIVCAAFIVRNSILRRVALQTDDAQQFRLREIQGDISEIIDENEDFELSPCNWEGF